MLDRTSTDTTYVSGRILAHMDRIRGLAEVGDMLRESPEAVGGVVELNNGQSLSDALLQDPRVALLNRDKQVPLWGKRIRQRAPHLEETLINELVQLRATRPTQAIAGATFERPKEPVRARLQPPTAPSNRARPATPDRIDPDNGVIARHHTRIRSKIEPSAPPDENLNSCPTPTSPGTPGLNSCGTWPRWRQRNRR